MTNPVGIGSINVGRLDHCCDDPEIPVLQQVAPPATISVQNNNNEQQQQQQDTTQSIDSNQDMITTSTIIDSYRNLVGSSVPKTTETTTTTTAQQPTKYKNSIGKIFKNWWTRQHRRQRVGISLFLLLSTIVIATGIIILSLQRNLKTTSRPRVVVVVPVIVIAIVHHLL